MGSIAKWPIETKQWVICHPKKTNKKQLLSPIFLVIFLFIQETATSRSEESPTYRNTGYSVEDLNGGGDQNHPDSDQVFAAVLDMLPYYNLVGGFNPSEKYHCSQIASFPRVGVKIKNIWNHHPVMSVFNAA